MWWFICLLNFLDFLLHIWRDCLRWLLRACFRIFCRNRRSRCAKHIIVPLASNCKKPDCVRLRILELHEHHNLSHRELAALFNQMYFAATGQSVGRTWVRQLLIQHAHQILHLQHKLKHRVPKPLAKNVICGCDTTIVSDASKNQHIVLGVLDHGTRLNLVLRQLMRFNTWTFLRCIFLAVGQFGKSHVIKTDNHPVFHAEKLKQVLRWVGIRQSFSRPASPWENGRIKRFFGSLKLALRDYVIRDASHLVDAMAQFRYWYNHARPHQHLNGQTPQQNWDGINPYQHAPKKMQAFSAWGGRLKGMVLRF